MKKTRPRPFQEATIRAALAALTTGSRRFLVADEVGLGKTVVAQGVIRDLIEARRAEDRLPLRVFYVCNSLAIARQNRRRILDLLDTKEARRAAECRVDRLTLMVGREPTHPELRLFTITPATSFPRAKGRPRKGRQLERERVADLVAATIPGFGTPKQRDLWFSFGVKQWNKEKKRRADPDHAVSPREVGWFREALKAELGTDSLEAELRRVVEEEGLHELMGCLRSALALHALRTIEPDLVVYDEFQRFRELLREEPQEEEARPEDRRTPSAGEASTARLLRLLRGDDAEDDERPALLMLSATPYRLFTSRDEDAADGGHHKELFEVLGFLAGHGEAGRTQQELLEPLFRRFRHGLQAGKPDLEARDLLVKHLSRRMARTERVGADRDGDARDVPHRVPVEPVDLAAFRDLDDWFPDAHRRYALPYWSSIPLPLQAMGPGYKAWVEAQKLGRPKKVRVHWSGTAHGRLEGPQVWPHAGARAILDGVLPPERLTLPWVPPSQPWWDLAGAWAQDEGTPAPPHKLLVFSRFRALPPVLSAILSFEAERHALTGSLKSGLTGHARAEEVATLRKSRRFTPRKGWNKLLAYFWPSPTLARIDVRAARTSEGALRLARAALRKELKRRGVRVRGRGRRDNAWETLAWLDAPHLAAWDAVEGDDTRLPALVGEWKKRSVRPPRKVSRATLDLLAEWCVAAPGVIFGRSLSRRVPAALDKHLSEVVKLSWREVRTRFDDAALRHALLASTGEANAPEALLAATVQGNLEAVLDEHLWALEACGHARGKELISSLSSALSLNAGSAHLHEPGLRDTFQVACRAAMPFTGLRGLDTGEQYRPDQLRQAFNSPFWPHVLVSTSVGQEGLDFHLWCQDLLHWDLPGNAVDLEQREGRVRRYCGLAVRRAWPRVSGDVDWDAMAEHAQDAEGSGGHGLSPWWITSAAELRRHFLDVPLSERRARLRRLKRRRVLYRLALGQPDQEDLVDELDRTLGELDPAEWALDLSPWSRARRD